MGRSVNKLARRRECDCGDSHRYVKLAFTATPEKSPALDIDGCYRLYWPTRSTTQNGLYTHSLRLTKMPEEDAIARAQASKRTKNGVHFAGPPEEGILGEEEHSRTFSTICEAVRSGEGESVMRANEEALDSVPMRANHSAESELLMLSLRQLFGPGASWSRTAVPPKKRILMAVKLAYTYLHLSDTAWGPRSQVLPDFWYMNGPGQEGLKARLPFLASEIDGIAGSKRTTNEGLINPY